MGMDRAEQIGLGSAIGAHVLLLLVLSLGIYSASEQMKRPASLSVSLVGEIAPVSTAPDAIQEDAALASEIIEETAPLAEAAPEPPTKAIASPPAKKLPVKKAPAKTARKATPKKTKPAKTSRPKKTGGFGKGFESRAGIGGTGSRSASKSSGSGKAKGTPAAKTGAQIRRSVNVALASQIRPYLRSCAPSGVDINKIRTFITLNLASNGGLNSVRFDRQTGMNASNRPQAGPLKQCALKAARQASPYRGLDPEYHSVWKRHKLQLKAR